MINQAYGVWVSDSFNQLHLNLLSRIHFFSIMIHWLLVQIILFLNFNYQELNFFWNQTTNWSCLTKHVKYLIRIQLRVGSSSPWKILRKSSFLNLVISARKVVISIVSYIILRTHKLICVMIKYHLDLHETRRQEE